MLPFFPLGPTALTALIGYFYKRRHGAILPPENMSKITMDVIIPAYNEDRNIILCIESILEQSIKPKTIFIVDDASHDRTFEFAEAFSAFVKLDVVLSKNNSSQGKTHAILEVAKKSAADVLFVLDADTILESKNYLEKLLIPFRKDRMVASACGIILPEFDSDRIKLLAESRLADFVSSIHESQSYFGKRSHKLQQWLANLYREELYIYLQTFIYHGEMIFFETIVNPVGCAVAYRKEILLQILKTHYEDLGCDMTTSEDIFLGFTFIDKGYKNVQLNDIYALTSEPRLFKLPKQIFLWSSAFLQSCYYFDDLVKSPFKIFYRWFFPSRKIENKHRKKTYKRHVNLCSHDTKEKGRLIGVFIFAALFEKISYPNIIIIMMIIGWWKILGITLGIEIGIYIICILLMYKKNKFLNLLKALFLSPIRYAYLLWDTYIILNFTKDIWITRNRKWKK